MTEWPFGLLSPNKYNVIYMDFPWQFQNYASAGVPQRAAEQHYQTMTVEQGANLPVARLGSTDCALFMWSTSSHTRQCFWLAHQWGFTFSTKAFCWAKLNKRFRDGWDDGWSPQNDRFWFMGLGHGTRRNTEDCWLFTRGQPARSMFEKDGVIKPDRGVRELIVAPIQEHSRKPEEAYDRIERLFDGPYCELFSRNSRAGWSSWGNEQGKFDV